MIQHYYSVKSHAIIGFANPIPLWQPFSIQTTKFSAAVLTSFSIANFKAFGPTPPQRVALKPLTLVFGKNSAGKSSLLHSLILAKNCHENGEFDVRPGCPISGDSVDLGGFRQYVHCGGESREPVTLSLSFRAPQRAGTERKAINGFRKLHSRSLSKSSDFTLNLSIASRGADSAPHISKITLEVDGGQLLRMVAVPVPKSGPSLMRIEHWEAEHPVSLYMFSECLDTRTLDEISCLREAVEAVLEGVALSAENTLFPHVFVERNRPSFDRASDERGHPNHENDPVRRKVELNFERHLGPLLQDIHDLLTISLWKFVYLGPLRNLPDRHLVADKLDGRNIAGGSAALKKAINDSEIRDKINNCLGKLNTNYKIGVQATLGEEDIRRLVERSVKLSLSTIIEDAVTVPRIQDEFDTIRVQQPDDFRAYVEANPDLHQQIAEYWLDAHSAYLEENEGEEAAADYTMEDAMDDVLNTVDGACALYSDQIIEHYLENCDRFDSLVEQYYSKESVERTIKNITEKSGRRELSIFDERSGTAMSLRDIGVGISQILPVLVHAYAECGALIAIEQPEIHIHPALQSEIADVFIESALGGQGNTFLIETHSEHLILRIMKRIRETTRKQLPEGATPIRPEDVQVVYVNIDPTTKQTFARELRIDPQGRFIDNWPSGFFEERLKELF